MTSPRIAVLQTGRAIPEALAAHGDYDLMCKRVVGRDAATADTYAVLDGHFPHDLGGYDMLVITGSKHGVYEDHPWIAPLEGLIQTAMDKGKRLIGICFGHQIMAQALGGRAIQSNKGLGVGLMDYQLALPGQAGRDVKLHAWHQDQVVAAPPGTQIIASSDFCPIAGLRYGDQAISLQPHPEFTRGYMRDLITARTGTSLAEPVASAALRSLEGGADNPVIADIFQAFINQ